MKIFNNREDVWKEKMVDTHYIGKEKVDMESRKMIGRGMVTEDWIQEVDIGRKRELQW